MTGTSSLAAPRSVAELADIVRDARAAVQRLRVVAGGTWSDAGTPASRIRADATPVSLRELRGVVAYVPGDLTLTVRAGTTLAELDAICAEHNQWCTLTPWGGNHGTVGATFATATNGPLARALGRPRDIALGLEFVDGLATTVRGGGRVVKNVAGFDLTRLLVGSFGALGVITEVTVRLRARPAVDRTWIVACEPGAAADIRRGAITPLAVEPLSAASAAALNAEVGALLVRFAGNAALVSAAERMLRALGSLTECEASAWSLVRETNAPVRSIEQDALALPLARRIKERFDPAAILNPGVLGESA